MTTRAPAQVARAERRASFSQRLDDLLRRHELTDREVERLTGVAHQHVSDWRDPDVARSMPFADATALPEQARVDLALAILDDTHAIVRVPAVEAGTADDLRDAAAAQLETSQVLTKHLGAIADGLLDAREGVELERECDEALLTILRIRERARAAQRERVVRLRAVEG